MPKFLITDDNFGAHLSPTVNGEQKRTGAIPRPYDEHPVGSYKMKAFDMPLIPRDQWVDRVKEMTAAGSFMRDVRRRGNAGQIIPSLDQDGIGYCWVHSATMSVILTRAKQGQPYKRLSAFMVGCLLTGYKDEGGWGAAGADFILENGVPDVAHWPEKSMQRSHDTPEMRANAALHKLGGVWQDMQAANYDRNLNLDQRTSNLLMGGCNIEDFNWWGHSVLIIGLTLTAKGMPLGGLPDLASLNMDDPRDAQVMGDVINPEGINSWTDDWGDKGEFTLTGSKANCDGGVAVQSAEASEG